MLSNAHLTLHSRMCSSSWVITPGWLSGSLRPFLYSSSVYSCHRFLMSSASVRPLLFLSFLCPSLHEMFLWYLQFSWWDLSSFPFYCFLLFLCIDQLRRLSYLSLLFSGTLHSNEYIFAFLLCHLFLFFYQLFIRLPQKTILPFFFFFPLDMVLITASCTMFWISVHSSSGTLCIRYNPLNLFVTSTV